jgi:hypothetical protein
MQPDAIRFFRFIFFLLFLGVFFAGIYLLRNFDRFFSPDPDQPGENSSALSYRRMQALVVWLHAMALTAGFAFLLD